MKKAIYAISITSLLLLLSGCGSHHHLSHYDPYYSHYSHPVVTDAHYLAPRVIVAPAYAPAAVVTQAYAPRVIVAPAYPTYAPTVISPRVVVPAYSGIDPVVTCAYGGSCL